MSRDEMFKRVITYIIIIFMITVSLYYCFERINNSVTVEITMKQSQPRNVDILYKDNAYDREKQIRTWVLHNENFETIKIKIPTKYAYGIDLRFNGDLGNANTLSYKNIKIKTLFSHKNITNLEESDLIVDNHDGRVNLVSGRAFNSFQLNIKPKLIAFVVAIIIVFVLRKNINRLFISSTTRESVRVVVFVSSIFFVFGTSIIVLDSKEYNLLEGRVMNTKPYPEGYTKILDGSFMQDFENYVNDQVPYREHLIEDYYAFNRLLMKKQFDDKYIASSNGEKIFLKSIEFNQNTFNINIENILKFSEVIESRNKPYYFYIVPSKEMFNEELIPSYAKDDSKVIMDKTVEALDNGGVNVINLTDFITQVGEETGEETHFNTDHHWTIEVAFETYKEILRQLSEDGIVEYIEPDFTTELFEEQFVGTDARRVAYGYRYNQNGSDFNLIYPTDPGNYTVIGAFNNYMITGSIIDVADGGMMNLDRKYLSQYEFYGSLRNRMITNNKLDNNKTLVLLGDSYSKPLGFFFSQSFENVVYLDQREFDNTAILNYLENNEYDAVVNLNYTYSMMDRRLFNYFQTN